MTTEAHEIRCKHNADATVQEISHLTAAIVDNTRQVVHLSEHVRQLQVSVAVLQEDKNLRDAGRRQQ